MRQKVARNLCRWVRPGGQKGGGGHNGAMHAERTDAAAAPRLAWVITGVSLLVAAVGLGALVTAGGEPSAIDLWWNGVTAGMPEGSVGFGLLMDFIGGGWFAVFAVPIGGAVLLLLARRVRGALYFLLASVMSAAIVQALKQAFGRARPDDILVAADYGSFPSGHTANAATIAIVLIVLFPRAWAVAVGVAWTLLMALSRTVLHAHWLSDTLGGALVGAGAAVLLAVVVGMPLVPARDPEPRPPEA